jgi:DHA1 family bicyclomycin/chloramphenicol resistance-like MFS transporter
VTTLQLQSAPVTLPAARKQSGSTQPNPAFLALLLGAFVAVGPLTIDMYLPALPTIGEDLRATSATVQLTLTGTLIGLALGQLVIGPLSDLVGRRRPLLAGTALHVFASLLVLLAPNVAVLGVLRVMQGVGTAAGAVVAMAVIRDLFTGRAAATMLSRLLLVMGVAPVLAPTLGGEILRFSSWRGIFVVLGVYGIVLLALGTVVFPETLPPDRRTNHGIAGTFRTYQALLRDRVFVGLILVAGLTMAGLFSYIAGSSFVFQEQFGLDQQQFGLLFGAGAFWLIAATQLNPVLLRRWSPAQVLLVATGTGALAGAVMVALTTTGGGGVLTIAVPLWAVLFACGLALPNAPALALAEYGESAGAAAALLGAVQFGVGAAVSPLVGLLGNNAAAMGAVILAALGLAMVVLVGVVRPWQIPDVQGDLSVAVAH